MSEAPTAILLAPNGATGALRGLVERLINAGIAVTTVDEFDGMTAPFRRFERPPCVLIDLRDIDAGDLDDWKHATDTLRRVMTTLPRSMPIAITDGATAPLIVACIHAGAADLIDLQLEGTGVARAIVQRVWARQAERASEYATSRTLRGMVEELVKDLVRTERRSIDLEEKLGKTTQEIAERLPAILLVLAEREVSDTLTERLEAAGIVTYAYVSGEEALREARPLAEQAGLDLALIAAQLPGIDGLEATRRLREVVPGLDVFLVTAVDDGDLAADAADLGVVGFVHDPLANIDEVVTRLAQLAHESLQRTRELAYLQRIKHRHERVLARYRSLPREG
ncbi:MAG: response regulator [Proteobacteria bacterium]|nr:response regulator [Pseudomonadota bacterium]